MFARPYEFSRGETIALAIDAVAGDPATVTAATAVLKPLRPGQNTLDAGAATAAQFTMTVRSAAGDIPAGWNLIINAATSSTLPAGRYFADARLVIGGAVIISEGVQIRISDSASG